MQASALVVWPEQFARLGARLGGWVGIYCLRKGTYSTIMNTVGNVSLTLPCPIMPMSRRKNAQEFAYLFTVVRGHCASGAVDCVLQGAPQGMRVDDLCTSPTPYGMDPIRDRPPSPPALLRKVPEFRSDMTTEGTRRKLLPRVAHDKNGMLATTGLFEG